jgi:hypothetical protein
MDGRTPEACRNCGSVLTDRFCASCGQARDDHLVSMRALLRDFADEQFSLNARLPRTLRALFLRPGLLTREYFEGRIAGYIRPFRLFLIATVAFFITLSFMLGAGMVWDALERRAPFDAEAMWETAQDDERMTYQNVNFNPDGFAALSPAVARRLQAQQDRINAMPPREAFRALSTGVAEAAARIAFLLVPGFALLLKLLHLFRRRLYAEHFVFALHFHAVAFAALTLALLLRHYLAWLLAGAYLVIYLVLALRTAYSQHWLLAVAKLFVLFLAYSLFVLVAVVGALLIGGLIA